MYVSSNVNFHYEKNTVQLLIFGIHLIMLCFQHITYLISKISNHVRDQRKKNNLDYKKKLYKYKMKFDIFI